MWDIMFNKETKRNEEGSYGGRTHLRHTWREKRSWGDRQEKVTIKLRSIDEDDK
jgi:hypothetical protein